MASEQGHLNVVKILLQHHARVDVFDEVSRCFAGVQLELCNSFMAIIAYGTALAMSEIRLHYHFTAIPPLSRAYRRQSCKRQVAAGCCKQGA